MSTSRLLRLASIAGLALPLMLGCDPEPPPASSDAGAGADVFVPPGTDAAIVQADAPPVGPTSPLVDPTCVDGQYREALPDHDASIADLVAGYASADALGFVEAILERRYPHGWTLVREGQHGFADCAATFLTDRSSASAVIGELGTLVHECGHIYDMGLSSGPNSVYAIRADLQLTGARGDATERGGATFARSLIRSDTYQALRPPCASGSYRDCDFYANTYLDGSPTDGSFQSGDQGFNMLLEEVLQYSNSLAIGYAFADQRGGRSVSDRDGMLTFLWYVERYLRLARLEHPSAYDHLVNGDGGRWRQLILTIWGRAWLYLEATEGLPGLGIDDRALMPLVTDAELVSEIERLRDAEGCP